MSNDISGKWRHVNDPSYIVEVEDDAQQRWGSGVAYYTKDGQFRVVERREFLGLYMPVDPS